jgi:hypothetical protein
MIETGFGTANTVVVGVLKTTRRPERPLASSFPSFREL